MHELDESLKILQTIEWATWLKSFLIIFCGYFLAKFISFRINNLVKSRLSRSQQVLLTRGIFSAVFFLFIAVGFQQLGFHITALLSAAGIITVAIGFAAQTSISNLISGVFLLGEHAIRIGDMIQLSGITGEVLSVDLFSVKLRTPDGILVRIPNEQLVKTQISNINHFYKRRLDLTLQVAHHQDLEKIEQLLLIAVEKNSLKVIEPAPLMFYTKYTPDGVELLLMSWTLTNDFGQYTHTLIKNINQLFMENAIMMALPRMAITTSLPPSPQR